MKCDFPWPGLEFEKPNSGIHSPQPFGKKRSLILQKAYENHHLIFGVSIEMFLASNDSRGHLWMSRTQRVRFRHMECLTPCLHLGVQLNGLNFWMVGMEFLLIFLGGGGTKGDRSGDGIPGKGAPSFDMF